MQLYGCSYNYVTKSTMMLQGYIIKSKNITLLKIRYLIFYALFEVIWKFYLKSHRILFYKLESMDRNKKTTKSIFWWFRMFKNALCEL